MDSSSGSDRWVLHGVVLEHRGPVRKRNSGSIEAICDGAFAWEFRKRLAELGLPEYIIGAVFTVFAGMENEEWAGV